MNGPTVAEAMPNIGKIGSVFQNKIKHGFISERIRNHQKKASNILLEENPKHARDKQADNDEDIAGDKKRGSREARRRQQKVLEGVPWKKRGQAQDGHKTESGKKALRGPKTYVSKTPDSSQTNPQKSQTQKT